MFKFFLCDTFLKLLVPEVNLQWACFTETKRVFFTIDINQGPSNWSTFLWNYTFGYLFRASSWENAVHANHESRITDDSRKQELSSTWEKSENLSHSHNGQKGLWGRAPWFGLNGYVPRNNVRFWGSFENLRNPIQFHLVRCGLHLLWWQHFFSSKKSKSAI